MLIIKQIKKLLFIFIKYNIYIKFNYT